MGLNLNTPQTKNYTGLNPVRSGSTAEPDYSVKYVPQELTEAQQAQARQNIGAAEEGGGGQQVQANWNETDTTSPAYIQNKPTIPNFPTVNNPFLVDRKTFYVYSTSSQAWFSANMDWHWNPIDGITTHDGSSNTTVSTYSGLTVIHSGQYWTMGGCSGNPGGGEIWIWLNYGFCNGPMRMSNPSQPVNLVVAGEYDNQTYDTLIDSDNNNMYYVWSLDNCQRTEYNKYGNFVLADVPIRGQIFMETPDSLINCNIHVPKTRLAEFTTYMTNAFGQQVVEDYILPKVSTYDFIAQCGWTMKMITLPTLPLTMTDANNNTISGDFVAQNITIV